MAERAAVTMLLMIWGFALLFNSCWSEPAPAPVWLKDHIEIRKRFE